MMQAIRDRASGFIAWTIIGLICVVLVATGGFEYFNTSPQDAVASVNGEDIALAEFNNSFARQRAAMRARAGGQLDPTLFDQPIFRRQHLEDMITQELRIQAARDSGLAIPPSRIRDQIANDPSFQVAGGFSPDQYVALLATNNLSPTQYEAQLSEDLLVRELIIGLNTSAFALPSETARAQQLQEQQRSFRYVEFNAADYLAEVSLTDEEVQAYYDRNPEEFTTPEQVTISYVLLVSDSLAADIEVTESTLQQRYEAQKNRFQTPERRLTSHILLETDANASADALREVETQAAELAERARGGEDFAALAQEFSDDIGSAELGGDLDWVEKDVMVAAFENALFDMEAGGISDPVKTAFGFHVIYLREIEESRGQTFEEARDELATEYRETEVERLYLEQQDRLYDLAFEDSGSLDGVADALGLTVESAGPFSRTGGEGVAANRQVIDAAFSDQLLLEGANSDPISLSDTETLVLRVESFDEAALQPLEDVAEEARESLSQERSQELAEAAAESLVAAAVAAGGLAEALGESAPDAETAEATPEQEEGAAAAEPDTDSRLVDAVDVPRFGRPGEVNSQLAQGVFRLPRPGASPELAVVPVGPEQFAAVALYGVSDGQEAEGAEERYASRITRGLVGQEVSGLDSALRESASINVREDRLNAFTNN